MAEKGSKKALVVGFGVAFVCSVLVSTAAVVLQPLQEKNRLFEKKRNIIVVSGLMDQVEEAGNEEIDDTYSRSVEPVILNLQTGEQIDQQTAPSFLKNENYRYSDLLNRPDYVNRIPDAEDIAGIAKIPTHIQIYYILSGGQQERIILPIVGKGVWSTMYGFLALDLDGRTVKGITFYEHGETPGLGGEIQNPRWQAGWKGKQVYNDQWEPVLQVLKGKITPTMENTQYKVDGLSGATLTGNGVTNTVRFWLGKHGYQTFLKNLSEEQTDE